MNNFEVTLSNGELITIIAESWEKAIETFYKSHTGFSGVLTEIKLANYGRTIYVQNTGDHETFVEHYGCGETTPIEVFIGKSLPPDGSLALSAKEVEQVNKAIREALKTEPHLNVGPSYEQMENDLLAVKEHNDNLLKEVNTQTCSLCEMDAEIAKLRLMVPELKHSSLPLDWHVISQKANHRRKSAERMYRKKYLKKKEECRYQTERADNAFEKISQLRSDLEYWKSVLRKYKNNIERAVKEERERQEENDAMRIVSLQTLLKEKKALVKKLEEENEALRNTVSELTSKNQSNKE